jgi:hypothetical protein
MVVFTRVKEPYRAWVRCFDGRISRTLFLTRDSPPSLPDGSGCWFRMSRMNVLRLQTSHLLLIRTNWGYGTVLMAACACQGCSSTLLLLLLYAQQYGTVCRCLLSAKRDLRKLNHGTGENGPVQWLLYSFSTAVRALQNSLVKPTPF